MCMVIWVGIFVIYSQQVAIAITIKVVLVAVRVDQIHGDTTHSSRHDDQVIQMANR